MLNFKLLHVDLGPCHFNCVLMQKEILCAVVSVSFQTELLTTVSFVLRPHCVSHWSKYHMIACVRIKPRTLDLHGGNATCCTTILHFIFGQLKNTTNISLSYLHFYLFRHRPGCFFVHLFRLTELPCLIFKSNLIQYTLTKLY